MKQKILFILMSFSSDIVEKMGQISEQSMPFLDQLKPIFQDIIDGLDAAGGTVTDLQVMLDKLNNERMTWYDDLKPMLEEIATQLTAISQTEAADQVTAYIQGYAESEDMVWMDKLKVVLQYVVDGLDAAGQ